MIKLLIDLCPFYDEDHDARHKIMDACSLFTNTPLYNHQNRKVGGGQTKCFSKKTFFFFLFIIYYSCHLFNFWCISKKFWTQIRPYPPLIQKGGTLYIPIHFPKRRGHMPEMPPSPLDVTIMQTIMQWSGTFPGR